MTHTRRSRNRTLTPTLEMLEDRNLPGLLAPVLYDTGINSYGVAAADLNGDGIPDLVTANELDGTVSILLGNGDGTFQPPTTFNADAGVYAVAVGDVNGDDNPDLVIPASCAVSTLAPISRRIPTASAGKFSSA